MTGIPLHPLRLKALSEGRLSVLRVPFREQPTVHKWQGRKFIAERAPYAPGDYFVREAWAWVGDGHDEPFIVYRATNPDQGCRWNPARTMVEHLSRYVLTLGPPVPGRLGEVRARDIIREGYPLPEMPELPEEELEIIRNSGAPDLALAMHPAMNLNHESPKEWHKQTWNAIYPRHPWSPDRWTWAYPARRKR